MTEAFHYWLAGGPILVPIALVCFGIWRSFFAAEKRLMGALANPPGFEDRLVADMRSDDPAAAVQRWESFPGIIAGAAVCVLRSLAGGRDPVQALDQYEGQEFARLDRGLVILGALTVVAPLLGLLGTVAGMIETFRAVAESSGDTMERVAGGISEALITTQVGLVVALPGVFGLARLHRLLACARTAMVSCRRHLLLGLRDAPVAARAGGSR